jgi:hypothetical protein
LQRSVSSICHAIAPGCCCPQPHLAKSLGRSHCQLGHETGRRGAVAEIRITNKEELEAWLQDKPREWAIAIAARAALRVVPLWAGFLTPKDLGREIELDSVILNLFKCVAISRLTALMPKRDLIAYAAAIAFDAAADEFSPANDVVDEIFSSDAAYAAFQAAHTASASGPWENAASDAVHRSAAAAYFAADAADAIWDSISADANALAARLPDAMTGPLWREGQDTDFAIASLQRGTLTRWVLPKVVALNDTLKTRDAHWAIWLEWYDAVLIGKAAWGLSHEAGNEVMYALLTLDEAEWKKGPEYINARLKALVDEAQQRIAAEAQVKPELPIVVPAQSPAAIEPVWDGERIVLPQTPMRADLDADGMTAALASLRNALGQLADDAELESNIDKRAVRKLRRLAEMIPQDVPTQAALFSLAHAQESLRQFQASVTHEWPDVLAGDYAALMLQYERTVRQFPRWREFARNAERGKLSH